MPTGYDSSLAENEQQELLKFYLQPNTLNATAKQFHVTVLYVRKLLNKFNIPEHTKEVTYAIRNMHSRRTCLEKYGTEYAAQSSVVKEKIKQINLEKYGAESYFASEDFKIKAKQTAQDRFGVDYFSQADTVRNKIINTNIERYGGNAPACSEDVRCKMYNTTKERYGAEHALQAKEIQQRMQQNNLLKFGSQQVFNSVVVQQKIKQTNLERYGAENPFASEQIKQKIKTANLECYGVENPSQANCIKEKKKETFYNNYGMFHAPSKRYVFDNVYFDSFPELCFYLYHFKNGYNIKREPVALDYYYDGNIYKYYPDFSVDDVLYEIKGDHFLCEDGSWQNPFDRDSTELMETKHQCAVKNNVKILYGDDYEKYINWFNECGYKKEDFHC